MAKRRQSRLMILAMVLAAHFVAVWFLASSQLRTVKTESGSIQLLPIDRLRASAGNKEPTPRRAVKAAPARLPNRTGTSASVAPQPSEPDNAIHPSPDWTAELQLAAKNSVTKELNEKRHEADFSHAFPAQPKRSREFAWNYAATHRVETLPQGGILVHLGDSCVLVFMPLPIVGCGIGKPAADGDLFNHE